MATLADFPNVCEALGISPSGTQAAVRCPCPSHKKGDRRPSASLTVSGNKLLYWCGRSCSFQKVMAATGTKPADWFLPEGDWRATRVNRTIIEKYDYRDEDGALQFQVVRTDPKGFFQRRPVRGLDCWIYQLGECWYDKTTGCTVDPDSAGGDPDSLIHLPAVRNVPYRLADIRKNTEQPVLIAEGERKADLLSSLGFTATCSAKGAGKWPVEFGGFFAGRDVVIFSDNDSVGELHAAQVAGSCLLYGCKSIRMIKAGEMEFKVREGGDIYDFCMEIGPSEAGILKLRQMRRQAVVGLVKMFPKLAWESK